MTKQDFTDAALVLLVKHMDLVFQRVKKIMPEIDKGMGGEWIIPLKNGRELFATPFWEMGEGIPVAITNADGETLTSESEPIDLDYEIIGDVDVDAAIYVATIKVFISMIPLIVKEG